MIRNAKLVKQPVYQQLYTILRRLSASPEYSSGQQFLTERQIVEQFGVSRPTANKALAALVSEGSLEFRKGVGTFLRDRKLDYDIRSLVSFTHKAESAGRVPSTQVLSFRMRDAKQVDETIRRALAVSSNDRTFEVERVRLADKTPVILERRWVPVHLCPDLTKKQMEGSIYSLWVNTFDLLVTDADQLIQAVNLSRRESRLLHAPLGAAAFLVSATGFTRKTPLWFERTLYRGDAYEFHHHRPAAGRLRRIESGLVEQMAL